MKRGVCMDEEIIQKIEEIRKELMIFGVKNGFQDPQVIKTSQMLDELINQYYRVTLDVSIEKEES